VSGTRSPELHADEIVRLADAGRSAPAGSPSSWRDPADDGGSPARRVLDLVPGPVPVWLELRLASGAEAVFDLPRHKVRVSQGWCATWMSCSEAGLRDAASHDQRCRARSRRRCSPRPAFARALTVTSEGVVAAGGASDPPPRDLAFRAALVAPCSAPRSCRRSASRARAERLRAQLEPPAQTFVLTYRVTGTLRRRPRSTGIGMGAAGHGAHRHAGAARTWCRGLHPDAGERPRS
jgi:hypothetical protein